HRHPARLRREHAQHPAMDGPFPHRAGRVPTGRLAAAMAAVRQLEPDTGDRPGHRHARFLRTGSGLFRGANRVPVLPVLNHKESMANGSASLACATSRPRPCNHRSQRGNRPPFRLATATRLAGFRRDFTLTNRLDRLAAPALRMVHDGDAPQTGLRPLRMALLSSHSVDHLLPAIRVAGLQRGLALSLQVAPYGLYRQALLGDDPELSAFAPQMVVLALDAHDAPLQLPLEASQEQVDAAV